MIQSYSDLQARVAEWLNRADLTLAIPTFIQLAEASFNKDERFRVPGLVVRAQAPITTQFMTLPPDLIEMENFRLLTNCVSATGAATLDYVSPAEMDEIRLKYQVAEQPRFYTIVGQEIEFLPVPGASYIGEMVYHGAVPSLSTNATNWILTNHPDLYLYGALLQSAPYLKDDTRVQTWGALYNAAADLLKVQTQRAAFGASPLKMRARSFG
jgi:hypothetical protein